MPGSPIARTIKTFFAHLLSNRGTNLRVYSCLWQHCMSKDTFQSSAIVMIGLMLFVRRLYVTQVYCDETAKGIITRFLPREANMLARSWE